MCLQSFHRQIITHCYIFASKTLQLLPLILVDTVNLLKNNHSIFPMKSSIAFVLLASACATASAIPSRTSLTSGTSGTPITPIINGQNDNGLAARTSPEVPDYEALLSIGTFGNVLGNSPDEKYNNCLDKCRTRIIAGLQANNVPIDERGVEQHCKNHCNKHKV